jgi:hypothetical protein
MAMVRLVCSGCGANLDVLDDGSGLASCGYCGATSRLRATTQPQPHYAVPVVGGAVANPWPQPAPVPGPAPVLGQHPAAQARPSVWRGVLAATVLMWLAGGFIAVVAYIVGFGVPNSGQPAGGRSYSWDSLNPFIVDLDNDGHEEILGLLRTSELSSRWLLTAISSADWEVMWETELVDVSDERPPKLYFGPGSAAAYVVTAARIQAYWVADGAFAWEQHFRAPIESVDHDGAQLRVALDGPADVLLDPATGSETAKTPVGSGGTPIVLRDHGQWGRMGSASFLNTRSRARDPFPGLDVVASYCLADGGEDVQAVGFPIEQPCAASHGLVWTARGALEYLVGYDPATQAERWRAELVLPGPARRLQTSTRVRVAVLGDDAIAGYEPEDADLRIRRFNLVDGRVVWEVVIPKDDSPGGFSAVRATREHVYLTYVGKLFVLDANTGEIAQTFGSSWHEIVEARRRLLSP